VVPVTQVLPCRGEFSTYIQILMFNSVMFHFEGCAGEPEMQRCLSASQLLQVLRQAAL
jgi:hypothetical protein